MKLFFDQNLSPRLVEALSDVFPGSAHVQAQGLDRSSDERLWDFARDNDFAIVTTDVDFSDRGAMLGHPPKVVWIRLGNCATADVARLLRFRAEDVKAFVEHEEATFLELG